jgi:hypothetical protein
MKEWVIPYVKEYEMKEFRAVHSQEWFDELKKMNFGCLDSDNESCEKCLRALESLTKNLHCSFCSDDPSRKHLEDNFKIIFASVLADLPKEQYDELCNIKNIFVIYGPPKVAYMKGFDADKAIEAGKAFYKDKHVQIVIFEHGLTTLDRLVARGIIVHELGHIILNEKDDDARVNRIVREWGFGKEIDEVEKWYGKTKGKVCCDH